MKLLLTVCCLLPSLLLAQTQLKLALWLQGPYDGSQMKPLPMEILKTKFPNVLLPTETVDQVLVEVFTSSGTTISQNAWLQRDGSVWTENGNAEFSFTVNEYFRLRIKHRNHLPIISEMLQPGYHELDFRKQPTSALIKLNSRNWGAPAGDLISDSSDYSEINASDYAFASKFWNESSGYWIADVNLDGLVTQQDLELISQNQNLLLYSTLK